jgi:hypothetical protein
MQEKCTDFFGNEIHEGDWLVRAMSYSSSKWLSFSRVESEPVYEPEGRHEWKMDIRTFSGGGWGGIGRFQTNKSAIKIPEYQVPAEILLAYRQLLHPTPDKT